MKGWSPELRGVRSLAKRTCFPASSATIPRFPTLPTRVKSRAHYCAVRWRNWRGKTPAANLTRNNPDPRLLSLIDTLPQLSLMNAADG